ncbi:MAG TPA: helix-turn-helix domain-containing protein, partial [Chloroflexia bacterium]
MGRRQGPSEERRAAILQAAEAVFTEAGYTGASIREIARRAEVSSALLYWFFPNKAKLFAAVLLAKVDAQGVLEFPPAIFAIPPQEFLPRL